MDPDRTRIVLFFLKSGSDLDPVSLEYADPDRIQI